MAHPWLSTRRAPLFCFLGLVLISVLSFHAPTSSYLSYNSFHYHLSPSLSSCPSVYDTGRPPIIRSALKCHAVPSKIPLFDLEVCYAEGTCNQFTLRISRTSAKACREQEATPDPSKDPALTKWMREQRGPDAFYMKTDGAERYASVYPTYEGQCTYSFDIRLKNPGDTYVSIWWTYERYTGFSETNASWPEMLFKSLSDPIALHTCPSYCTTQLSAPLVPTQKINNHPPLPSSRSHFLPNCSGPDPIPGSYIPAHPLDVLYPPEVLPQPNDVPVMGRYGFVPEACTWRHAGLRFSHSKDHCTKKDRSMRMYITGDSHGRSLYDAVRHRLEGHTDTLLNSEKIGSKGTTIDQLNINFLWDPKGLEFLDFDPEPCGGHVRDADIIVVSTVAHYRGHSTTAHYLSQLRKILSGYAACPYHPSSHDENDPHPQRKLILLYSPAIVQRWDEYVIEFKDHGTNIRMRYWRDESQKVAKELGWMFVDQYDLTLPHSLEPRGTDMAHYLANDAIDPIVDEVLGKTGLCD